MDRYLTIAIETVLQTLFFLGVIALMALLGCTQYHESHISHADFVSELVVAGWTPSEAEEEWLDYQKNKSRY